MEDVFGMLDPGCNLLWVVQSLDDVQRNPGTMSSKLFHQLLRQDFKARFMQLYERTATNVLSRGKSAVEALKVISNCEKTSDPDCK